jgi:hypothetical protein
LRRDKGKGKAKETDDDDEEGPTDAKGKGKGKAKAKRRGKKHSGDVDKPTNEGGRNQFLLPLRPKPAPSSTAPVRLVSPPNPPNAIPLIAPDTVPARPRDPPNPIVSDVVVAAHSDITINPAEHLPMPLDFAFGLDQDVDMQHADASTPPYSTPLASVSEGAVFAEDTSGFNTGNDFDYGVGGDDGNDGDDDGDDDDDDDIPLSRAFFRSSRYPHAGNTPPASPYIPSPDPPSSSRLPPIPSSSRLPPDRYASLQSAMARNEARISTFYSLAEHLRRINPPSAPQQVLNAFGNLAPMSHADETSRLMDGLSREALRGLQSLSSFWLSMCEDAIDRKGSAGDGDH